MSLLGLGIPGHDSGAVGEARPRRRAEDVYRLAIILFVTTVLLGTLGLWKTERDSCLRNAGVRAGFNGLVTIQGQFLSTARDRNLATYRSPKSDATMRASALEAVRAYDRLISAQRPVKTLDCGGVFPDNQ